MSHVSSSVVRVPRPAFLVLPLALAFAASAPAAESVNAGGLLRIDSKAVNTVVNVPWVGFGADGPAKPIDVASLVKTRNLVPGDTVMAVRPNGVYEAWTVSSARVWEPVTTVSKGPGRQTLDKAPAAAERALARGVGLWLVRCGEGADLAKPFYVSGQCAAAAPGAVTVAGCDSGAAAWTLLANPDRAKTDLNAINWGGGPAASDQITVVAPGGGPRTYTWRNGKWGTGGGYVRDETTGLMKQQPRVEAAVAPAGAAIWYVRARGGDAFAFSWR